VPWGKTQRSRRQGRLGYGLQSNELSIDDFSSAIVVPGICSESQRFE
jgi:hypothetical protein